MINLYTKSHFNTCNLCKNGHPHVAFCHPPGCNVESKLCVLQDEIGCPNFTVFDLSKDVACYIYFWLEAESDLTSNELASCVTGYVDNLDERIEEVTGTVVLAHAFLKVSHDQTIRIVQQLLEKGHTQMQVDSVHSIIERKLYTKLIYSPQNYRFDLESKAGEPTVTDLRVIPVKNGHVSSQANLQKIFINKH